MKDNLKKGKKGEEFVLKDYLKRGYKLLEKNLYFRGGEIDLIFKKDNLIVVVEVKTRKKGNYLEALLSIDKGKVKRLIKYTKIYLESKKFYEKFDVRFDVAVLDGNELNIIENAIYDEL
ncbi:MAG: YraN family protein [Candidatus Hydrothermales bacterium]